MAGLRNKDKDFWKGLKEWNVMVLIETWMDEKRWKVWKEKLPRGYRWEVQYAGRINKKGRARGGMLMGIRIGLSEKEEGIKTIIGADFNTRTGNLGGGLELEEEEEWNKGGNKGERNSKDTFVRACVRVCRDGM